MSYRLLLNSAARTTSSTSSSNFTVNLQNPVFIHEYRYIRLSYCMLYNTIYNVTNSNNNVDFKVSGVTYTATISAGTYNANTLATALQTAMTSALSNSWTITYNTNQMTYTIGGTTAFQLLFSSGTHASTSLWQILGFASSNGLSGIDTTSATSATSTQVVNFTQPLCLYINLTNICTDRAFTAEGDSFSFMVPIDVNGGSVIEYDMMSNFNQYIEIPRNLHVINSLSVTLTTRNAQSVSLNGSEWTMLLELTNEL